MPGSKPESRRITAPRSDLGQSRMWKSMRHLRRFTRADIEATAEVGRMACGKYVRALTGAGYLIVTQPVRSGIAAGHAEYRLARNTGPAAPRLSKDGIFDPNLVDPYKLPPRPAVSKHAHAFLKCLRELLDELENGGADLKARIKSGRDAIALYEKEGT